MVRPVVLETRDSIAQLIDGHGECVVTGGECIATGFEVGDECIVTGFECIETGFDGQYDCTGTGHGEYIAVGGERIVTVFDGHGERGVRLLKSHHLSAEELDDLHGVHLTVITPLPL